jgi:hypothetical protein
VPENNQIIRLAEADDILDPIREARASRQALNLEEIFCKTEDQASEVVGHLRRFAHRVQAAAELSAMC